MYHSGTLSSTTYGYYTGTFSDTSTNTYCSSWSKSTGRNVGDWDEFGEDKTTDEYNNPTNCQIEIKQRTDGKDCGQRWELPSGTTLAGGNDLGTGNVTNIKVETLIVCSGSISWVKSGSLTTTDIDYDSYTDGNIPTFTLATETSELIYIQHNIPSGTFSPTISSSFGTALVEDYEAGCNIQYKLTNATEDTGWLNYNEVSTFTAFTSEPTKCVVKLIPKTTSPTTGYPSIKGFSIFGEGN